MRVSDYRLGIMLVTASATAWSLAGFFTRLIHLDTWTMLAWRGIFGAFGIAVVILLTSRPSVWRRASTMSLAAWSFALISAAGMVFFVTSLRHTTVAHVSVIYATVPFFAAVLGWTILRERPSRRAIIASLAALVGVAVMVGLGSEGAILGDLLAVGMTIAMAATMVIARRFHDVPMMPAACLSALISGLACWPLGHPLGLSGTDLSLLALFGLVNSAAGLALFTLGARLLPAMETALIGSLDAPLAPFWVWLAFGDVPSVSTTVGGLIVFAAVGWYLALSAGGPSGPVASTNPSSSPKPAPSTARSPR